MTIASTSPPIANASAPDLSFVIPVKDEAESLPELIRRILAVVRDMGRTAEIICIDDGSTDGSLAVLETLAQQHPELFVIAFRRTFGKSAGLAAGFERARGTYVFTMDADLQDDPDEIPRFVEAIETGPHGVISGRRWPRNDPWHKTIPSKIYNFFANRTTGLGLHDMNCGFKIYRREVIKEIKLYGEMHRFIPVLAAARGFTASEIKIKHHRRQHGRSKYGVERYLRGALDLLTVQFLTGYSFRPLHIIGALGFFLFGIGFDIELYLTIRWFQGHEIQGRPLFFLGILLMLIGVQILLSGLLTVLQLHTTSRTSDQYAIAREIHFDSPLPSGSASGSTSAPPPVPTTDGHAWTPMDSSISGDSAPAADSAPNA